MDNIAEAQGAGELGGQLATGHQADAPPRSGPEHGGGRFALPVLLSLVFLSIIGYGVVVPLLPFYGELFGAPPWQVTLMFSVFAVGQLSGELFWGPLSDKIGRKPVLLISMFSTAAGYVMLAAAPNIWVAIAARCATGFSSGNLSTIQSYMVDVSPRERLAARLGLISASMGIGLVVGPAIGGLLARPELGTIGFALPVVAAGALCVVAGTAALFLLRESQAAVHRSAPSVKRLDTWKAAAADPVLRLLLGTTFLAYVAFAVLNSTIGLWGHDRFAWTPKEVGGLMAVTGASMAITQVFITGRVARWLGEPATVVLGMTIGGLSLLALPMIPNAAWAAPVVIMSTVGMSLYQPSTISLASDSAGPERRGAVLGVNSASGALGRVAGPLGSGALISGVSMGAPFFFGGASMLLGGLLALGAGRLLRGRSKGA